MSRQKTTHVELKFVPSSTPIAVNFTLKKSASMRALKSGRPVLLSRYLERYPDELQ